MASPGEPTSIPSNKIAAEPSKILDFSKASGEEVNHDPLLKKLKAWDKNGDGKFSADEVLAAAREVHQEKQNAQQARTMTTRMMAITCMLGFLLFLSMGGNFCATIWALQIAKQDDVPETSGVMLTSPKSLTVDEDGSEAAPKPVGTSIVKVQAQGLSGLKESTKEELEALQELSFFHDGGYHLMKVAQVHRYDGRVEVWAYPVGIVVVEDTGEVHYAPHGVPGVAFEQCWGTDGVLSDICGETVDNEGPINLEVESPVEQDPENAPAPPQQEARRLQQLGVDANGDPIYEDVGLLTSEDEGPYHAVARRLSGRRRSGGSSRRRAASTSSRRRSGSGSGFSGSARRRSYGGTTVGSSNTVSGDSRRRTLVASPSPSPSPQSATDLVSSTRTDGGSRRRSPNYYNTPMDSRRRSISAGSNGFSGTQVAGAAAVGAAGGYVLGNSNGHSSYQVDSCPSGMHRTCSGNECWCDENASAAAGGWIGLVLGGSILFCICLCIMGFVAMHATR